ncbi:MAG: nucleotidyltransferase domain-containing protein [Candidatus Methylomirabilia bacterium]
MGLKPPLFPVNIPRLVSAQTRGRLELLLALETSPEPAAATLREGAPHGGGEAGRELLETLEAHGLAPWAHDTLGRAGLREAFALDFLLRLKDVYRATVLRNRVLFASLEQIGAACARRGVALIPLKGAALARRLYGNPGLRPMQDLDLLVKPADVEAAAAVLREAGYVVPPHLDEAAARREHFHCVFERPARGIKVELHWSLSEEASLAEPALARLWERSAAGEDGMRALDPATELVAVAAHAWKHGYLNPALVEDEQLRPLLYEPLAGNRLVWLLDLHRLMRAGAASPAACRERAREWSAPAALAGAVALAAAAFGPVAGWGGDAVRERDASLARYLILRRLARGLAAGSPRTVRLVQRATRMDPHLQARPIRALDLLDAFRAPAAIRALRERGGFVLAPLGWVCAAAAGAAAVGAAAGTALGGRARRRRFRRRAGRAGLAAAEKSGV